MFHQVLKAKPYRKFCTIEHETVYIESNYSGNYTISMFYLLVDY